VGGLRSCKTVRIDAEGGSTPTRIRLLRLLREDAQLSIELPWRTVPQRVIAPGVDLDQCNTRQWCSPSVKERTFAKS
jgi:hypothetical protein